MSKLISFLRSQDSTGLLLVRLVMASILIVAGYSKFFMAGLERVTTMFDGYGIIPLPAIVAPFIAALELGGGVLLALGLFTRYLGVLYFIEFIVAAWVKYSIVAAPGGGYLGSRLDTMLIVVALVLATHGAGKLSLDAKLGRSDA
jgi:putative oxidoreductase